jgi:hypothetical protein
MGVEVAPKAVEEMTGCVCFALRKTARAVTQFYDRALRSHRLRVTQLSILVGASRFGAVPLAKLARGSGHGPHRCYHFTSMKVGSSGTSPCP